MNPVPFPFKFDRDNYPAHYLASHVSEAQVQADILQLLHAYKVDAVAVDAGGRRARGRMMAIATAAGIEARSIGRVGLGGEIPAGFADLEATLAPNGRGFYIEVKAPAWTDARGRIQATAGAATEEQISFLFSKWRRGALVLVAWSIDDVMRYAGNALKENSRLMMHL